MVPYLINWRRVERAIEICLFISLKLRSAAEDCKRDYQMMESGCFSGSWAAAEFRRNWWALDKGRPPGRRWDPRRDDESKRGSQRKRPGPRPPCRPPARPSGG